MKRETRITLKSNRLNVDLQIPGTHYRGARFDWCGMIEQVQLDNKYLFCTMESLDQTKGSKGFGLCNEFGLEKAIGYHEMDIGQYFTKIGVGALRKDSTKDYDFMYPYTIMKNKIVCRKDDQSIIFCTEQSQLNGYAYVYEKHITIKENYLEVDYYLKNTGIKDILTTEYCHNFISLNGTLINENYELELNSEIEGENNHGVLLFKKNIINWLSPVKKVFYHTTNQCNKLNSWCLTQKQSGLSIKETLDEEVYKFALWGDTHVVSPEMFVFISLTPNETKKWKRTYEFNIN